jgi:RNA polymerase sigma-70 factor (ECF subfamily)
VTDIASHTARLWDDLHASLRSFVSRRIANPADVDDVLQQVFVQVHRGLPSLRDDERVHAWIYRTARHVIVDYYRRPARRREQPSGGLSDFSGETAADVEALTLAELRGLTQAEAARRVGVSTSGMKSRVQRARQRLKSALDACCRFELDRRGGLIAFEAKQADGCGGCDTCGNES